MSIIKKLYKHGHLNIGQHWATETHYEVMCGSIAYGANSADNKSDIDIHSITTPPIDYVFPWVDGNYVPGFGNSPQNFETFQQHGILAYDNNYDVAIYSIIKTFQLAADNCNHFLFCFFRIRQYMHIKFLHFFIIAHVNNPRVGESAVV